MIYLNKLKSRKIMKSIIDFRIFAFILSFFFPFLTAFAQGEGHNIDKIVAKIDNYIILKSEVENAYINYLASGNKAESDTRCQILKQLLVEKVLVAKAEIDSVTVDESEVDTELAQRMAYFVQEAGSEEILEKRFGKKLTDLREELRPQMREQLTARKMRRQLTDNIAVTPSDVKRFFNAMKNELPTVPAEYEVGQIMKFPLVAKAEKQEVIDKLNALKNRVLAGEDFAVLAKEFSEDFGSAAQGGSLGFRGRGELVPEFEATIFKLEPGQISEPIESQFGIHLIQLVERRGNRFNSRHILIRPRSGDTNFEKTTKLLDSIRTLIVEKKIPFEKAAKEFSDDRMTKNNGGFFTGQSTQSARVMGEELDYAAFRVIDTMTVGSLSKPVVFRDDEGKEALRILYFRKKIPAHAADFKEDYEKLAQIVLADEKNKYVDKWFKNALGALFIDINKEFDECKLLEYE
jgi:peptidyl-prolyl cis-trans isomerase SurA